MRFTRSGLAASHGHKRSRDPQSSDIRSRQELASPSLSQSKGNKALVFAGGIDNVGRQMDHRRTIGKLAQKYISSRCRAFEQGRSTAPIAVSYTHLTLP